LLCAKHKLVVFVACALLARRALAVTHMLLAMLVLELAIPPVALVSDPKTLHSVVAAHWATFLPATVEPTILEPSTQYLSVLVAAALYVICVVVAPSVIMAVPLHVCVVALQSPSAAHVQLLVAPQVVKSVHGASVTQAVVELVPTSWQCVPAAHV